MKEKGEKGGKERKRNARRRRIERNYGQRWNVTADERTLIMNS